MYNNKIIGSPVSNDDNRIYDEGSSLCAVGQFPYLVSIKVDNIHRCGGWIYNERWIVTSTSCVQGYIISISQPISSISSFLVIIWFHLYINRLSASSVVVTVGENVLNEAEGNGKVNYIVQNIIPYTADGGYNATTGLHNIAVIQVSIPIIYILCDCSIHFCLV